SSLQRRPLPERLRHPADLAGFPHLRFAQATGRESRAARRVPPVHQLHAQEQPDLGAGRSRPALPPGGHQPRVCGAPTPGNLCGLCRAPRLRSARLVQWRRRPTPGASGSRLRFRPQRPDLAAARGRPVPGGDGGPAGNARTAL
ncbi:MAG: hypothetical protein AVDCRST_MAG59-4013, partial [uncultured Thermomicrobiales bacterium]